MRVAIVGAGKLGLKVTAALLGGDHSITVIDKNEDVLSKISQQMDVMMPATSTSLLKECGVEFDFLR
ncbi:MAG: NAD-binding protein [Anaerovoracaceae bacterium]